LSQRGHFPSRLTSPQRRYRKSRAKTSVPLVGPDRGGYFAARFDLLPNNSLLRSTR
jgi:hypothetical protein